MKSLKSLLTLGIAMAVYSASFAESAKPVSESTKQAVTSAQNFAENTATDKMASSKAKVEQVKAQVDGTKKVTKKVAKVNVNTADAKTLQTLNGIGEVKAKAIMDYRKKHGKIKNLKELGKVSGIGEATLEQLKGSVSF